MRALRHPAAPVLAVAAIAAVWAAAAPHTADMAAHAYRAWLWDTEGFTVWNNQWYGGHHVPGYSLLFPPLASVLGAWVAVAAAGTFAAATLVALERDLRGQIAPSGHAHGAVGAWALALGAAANVLVGRGPFILGVGFGALALLLVLRERLLAATLAALACTWASPVAGLFLGLALAARFLATPSKPVFRSEAAPALAVIIGGALMILPFPEGGQERFVATAFWPMLAITLAAAALIDRRHRAIAIAAGGYVLLLIAAFLLPTPVGQNATRLGVLAGPAIVLLCARGPKGARIAVIVALLYLGALPAYRALHEAQNDPATAGAFHEPLLDYLKANAAPGDRVEIPLTRNHWEAVHVAKHRAIARGWERQLDLKVNDLFYDDEPLTAARYEAWLRKEQIRWVALPDAPLDFSAKREARLISSMPGFLNPVKPIDGWQIYRVDAVPPSPITKITPNSITVDNATTLPFRHTRYWRVAAGRGCVREAPDERVATTGTVRIEARLTGPRCR